MKQDIIEVPKEPVLPAAIVTQPFEEAKRNVEAAKEVVDEFIME